MIMITNNDTNDNYNNHRHISIEIINSEKLKLLGRNIENKLNFAHEL